MAKVTKQCERCSKTFTSIVSRTNINSVRFCSKDCFHPPLTKTCEFCGMEYRTHPSTAAASRFCSPRCRDKGVAAERSRGLIRRVTKTRKGCQGKFEVIPSHAPAVHFCSNACKGAVRRIHKTCAHCGRRYFVKKSRSRWSKYCSRACKDAPTPMADTKLCSGPCGLVLPLKYFHKQLHGKYGKASFCKNCVYACYGNADTRRARRAYTAKVSVEMAWARDKARDHTRRSEMNGATGRFSPEQLLQKCELWGWACYLCGVNLTLKTITVEHRIPLAQGGTNWIANIAPACKQCNSSKSSKTEAQYRNLIHGVSSFGSARASLPPLNAQPNEQAV